MKLRRQHIISSILNVDMMILTVVDISFMYAKFQCQSYDQCLYSSINDPVFPLTHSLSIKFNYFTLMLILIVDCLWWVRFIQTCIFLPYHRQSPGASMLPTKLYSYFLFFYPILVSLIILFRANDYFIFDSLDMLSNIAQITKNFVIFVIVLLTSLKLRSSISIRVAMNRMISSFFL